MDSSGCGGPADPRCAPWLAGLGGCGSMECADEGREWTGCDLGAKGLPRCARRQGKLRVGVASEFPLSVGGGISTRSGKERLKKIARSKSI